MGRVVRDLTGQVFGRLTAIAEHGRSEAGRVLWRCQCACGVERIVLAGSLTRGQTVSCGCRHRPLPPPKPPKPQTKRQQVVATKRTKEYQAWASMINRCYNDRSPWFKHYGGRGIEVCDRWLYTPVWFIKDMGDAPSKSHSLERIDNDGPYSPENCVWALPKDQGRNRRTNKVISFCGTKATAVEWAEFIGISPAAFHSRLRRGMPPVLALVM
jgi:hypothetical protein